MKYPTQNFSCYNQTETNSPNPTTQPTPSQPCSLSHHPYPIQSFLPYSPTNQPIPSDSLTLVQKTRIRGRTYWGSFAIRFGLIHLILGIIYFALTKLELTINDYTVTLPIPSLPDLSTTPGIVIIVLLTFGFIGPLIISVRYFTHHPSMPQSETPALGNFILNLEAKYAAQARGFGLPYLLPFIFLGLFRFFGWIKRKRSHS